MRFSSFLLGSLVGATAVMYLSRRGSGTMMSSFTQAGESVGNMMNKAKSNFSGFNAQQNNSHPYSESAAEDKVKEIISEEPHLKNEFNQIMAESNQKTNYQTQ
jgi:hypothetical protein